MRRRAWSLYVVVQLTMLSLSLEFVKGSGDLSVFEAAGTLLLEARDWAFAMGAGLAFNLSALLLNYILYRSKLVLRWLSGWGFLGAALWMIVWFPQIYDVELGVLEVPLAAVAALAAFAGRRKGEILGLQRRHIDLDRATVRVEHARQGKPN